MLNNGATSSVFLSQLREQLLSTLIDTINEVPDSTLSEIEMVARGLSSLIVQGDELSLEAQVLQNNFFLCDIILDLQ